MIEYISEDKILELIEGAKKKLAIIAPALSNGVAKAIRDKVNEDNSITIQVIVDMDANVYRMGYGDESSLSLLKEFLDNGRITLSKQSGLRVGLVVSDNNVLIFAPTAKMVEADPISEDGSPLVNGLMLTDDLFCNNPNSEEGNTPVVSAILDDVERKPDTGEQPTIGAEEIKEEDIKQEQESLDEVPPKPFDIQRRIEVYSSKLTFVEFTISFEKFSVKKIAIPKSITIVKDKQVDDRISSQLSMFQEMKNFAIAIPDELIDCCNEKMINELLEIANKAQLKYDDERKSTDGVDLRDKGALCETSIKAMGDWIRKEYTIHIDEEYGNAMLYKDKSLLQKDLAWLQRVIDHYHNECAEELMRRSAEIINKFAMILLPIAKENPSTKLREEIYKRHMFEREDEIILNFVRGELASEVMKISTNAQKRSTESKKIKAIFKNVSFDSINNEDEFLDKLKGPFVDKFGEDKFNELFHIEEVITEKS